MMIPRRALPILAIWFFSGSITGADAREAEKASSAGEIYRVFYFPGRIDWHDTLGVPRVFGRSYPPDPRDPTRHVAAGKLASLLEQKMATDLSKMFRAAGIDIPNGGALETSGLPLLFVRAAPGEMEKIERFHDPVAWLGSDDLWCRMVVVANAPGSRADEVTAILKAGKVLSDLIVFTFRGGEIRLGSLADESDSKEPEEWGASLRVEKPLRDQPGEAISVAVSLCHPPDPKSGQRTLRLDWEGTRPLSSIGKTTIVPVTFDSGGEPGFLILRFESIPSFAWNEPIADLIRRKEALWRKIGPGFEPDLLSGENEWDEDAWVRKYFVVDPATESVYYEAIVPPSLMKVRTGSTPTPPRAVSTAGFQDLFGAGKLFDVQAIFNHWAVNLRPGDVAVYSPSLSKLFVRVAPEEIPWIVDTISGFDHPGEVRLRLRTDMVESPRERFDALTRPLRSTMRNPQIVDSRTLSGRSGQRSRADTGSATLEWDPVIGPRDQAIDNPLTLTGRFGGGFRYAVKIQGVINRDQTALIQLGSPPDSPDRVHHIAICPELLTNTGKKPLPVFEALPENGDGLPGNIPKTPWEKRGPEFKLVPDRP